jgi:hypothetical protein
MPTKMYHFVPRTPTWPLVGLVAIEEIDNFSGSTLAGPVSDADLRLKILNMIRRLGWCLGEFSSCSVSCGRKRPNRGRFLGGHEL